MSPYFKSISKDLKQKGDHLKIPLKSMKIGSSLYKNKPNCYYFQKKT